MTNKPNIIFILTDDQGYGDLGAHANPVLKTPCMDQLFRESVRFRDFCVSPSCSPTRCALMTGMHEFKSSVSHTRDREYMSLDSITLPQLLKRAGYATGMFGKWHIGKTGRYRPEHRGFDLAITTADDSQQSHFNPTLFRNGVEEVQQGYRTDILFNEATQFIERHKDGPFFCYIPTYSPHAPLHAPEESIEPYRGKVTDDEATFFGMIANIDENLGKLMANLKAWGIEENTLVIFMNDNGGTAGIDLFNADMRGCKGTSWFGGTRAMSLWRWPGRFEPNTVDELTAHVDLLPTLAELAGVELGADHAARLDGYSLVPLLTAAGGRWPDRLLFTHMGRWPDGTARAHRYAQCAVRKQQYQLVRSEPCADEGCRGECRVIRRGIAGQKKVAYSQTKGDYHYAGTQPQGEWALYDVTADPGQEENLAASRPELVKELASAYDAWWDSVVELVE